MLARAARVLPRLEPPAGAVDENFGVYDALQLDDITAKSTATDGDLVYACAFLAYKFGKSRTSVRVIESIWITSLFKHHLHGVPAVLAKWANDPAFAARAGWMEELAAVHAKHLHLSTLRTNRTVYSDAVLLTSPLLIRLRAVSRSNDHESWDMFEVKASKVTESSLFSDHSPGFGLFATSDIRQRNKGCALCHYTRNTNHNQT
jgi:hypothetical protein